MPSKQSSPHVQTLLTGLAFGESPRWHENRLWFSNWGAQEVVAVDLKGKSEVIVRVPSFTFSIDWLPDGRLLIVSASDLLRREPDGSLVAHADLTSLSDRQCNEIVVDGRGNTYINATGFDLLAGEKVTPGIAARSTYRWSWDTSFVLAGEKVTPGIVALVAPDGSVQQVGDGVFFPNGMAVTPDNSTLIVAESYGKKLTAFDIAADGGLSNRRVWADLGNAVPDGICLDSEGAVWYGDVPNKRCVRVREGGEVLQTIDLDRGCFACMLGGVDNRTLFMMAADWHGRANLAHGPRTGQLLTVEAPAPGVGWP